MTYNKLVETTDWGVHEITNKIYYTIDKNTRIVAYQIEEGGEVFRFKNPKGSLKFSTRGRTFKKSVVSSLPI